MVEVAGCPDCKGVQGTDMREDGIADMVAACGFRSVDLNDWIGMKVGSEGMISPRKAYPYRRGRRELSASGAEIIASPFHKSRTRICYH